MGVLKLVKYIKKLRGTVSKIIRASQTAEDRRIKDLNAQLDFDCEIEQVHQNTINDLLHQAWLAEVRKSEREWQKKTDVQQQVINSRQQPNEALVQPCATDSQYPCPQDKTISFFVQKAKYLSNLSTQPCGVQETKDDESGHKENAVTSMTLDMALMQSGTHMNGHTIRSESSSLTREDKMVTNSKCNNNHWGSATCSGDRMSPDKHKLDDAHGVTSRLRDANWSRKRARTDVTR
ncbi:hypothetical protein GGP41_010460 [Bipolaris sorokiniana]|uniref:Uncharacterized protein n=1 Tax=Cochliobolus sativus TaxID=45130 RepID=A0A8H5ZME7_COCSA|nr:hypothetical protein GGP41_010460 [Bipolaris sorokiniana]